MGICFDHALLVRDLTWRPTKERAEAIHSVLVQWRIAHKRDKPDLFEIRGSRANKVDGKTIVKTGQLPDELVLSYPMTIGDPVREVMGPFESEEEEGFQGPGFWSMCLVLGRDFKILEGADYGPVNTSVHSDISTAYRNAKSSPVGLSIPASWTATPPKTSVTLRDPTTGEPSKTLPDHLRTFSGVWRSGLWFDFDKVYPAFHAHGFGKGRSYGGLGRIPNREFVADLERAFGTSLLEVGAYY